MKPMPSSGAWRQLRLRARGERAEWVAQALWLSGCAGVEWIDSGHLVPPQDLQPDEVELRGSLPVELDVDAVRLELARLLGEEDMTSLKIVPLDEQDWAESWKAHFEPVRIGRFFVHPGWVQPNSEDGLALRIDPGLAFGTGMHPTTRLCLAELDRALPVDSLLDVGCGSGLLALAGALAGVGRILAMDNDPEAVRVSRENAGLNGLCDRLSVQGGLLQEVDGRYQLVLANILSGTLIELAPDLRERLQPGALLILSGILGQEADLVQEAYVRLGLIHEATIHQGEWCALRFREPCL